nr:MAG TPA: hypothetical protein [Caudoviricetes sp.]
MLSLKVRLVCSLKSPYKKNVFLIFVIYKEQV